ncbi:MAG: response regulator [Deltaproteobacteria bacterium]|nr:MAG: response regulator [Deltaproteobacteria bacterium]
MSVPRVLIVDDDVVLLKALPEALQLRMEGVAVDTCDSAPSALRQINATDYDAIVADIKMPGMDGLALLAEIRALRPETPTLLITGHGHDDLAVLALRGGAYDFIQKPIEREYFLASLRRAIEARENRRHLHEQQEILEWHARELESIVEQRTHQLREANRLKEQFLATLSHELRSPLGAIRMWSSLLRSGKLDAPRTVRALDGIERSAILQEQLVEDLLDVSRIAAGKLVLDLRPVNPKALVEAALDAIRGAAEAKQVRLEAQFEFSEGQVRGDPVRLQQVVWNLLSNAVKFSAQGGHVVVRLAGVDEQVVIAVQDEGEGIAPEFLPHVFERFWQADATRTRAHGGLGLGLAIVRELVHLHGGSVEAASEGKGRGTTLTVRLPLVCEGSDAEGIFPPRPALSGERFHPTPTLKGVQVLVVDDDPDARESIAVALEQSGACVHAVGSAAEAVESLERNPPDVLLSDIAMPGMDGYALLRQARARLRGARVVAAALTAYAGEEDRRRALAAGFQMHLAKPVEPAELVATVAKLAYAARARLGGES